MWRRYPGMSPGSSRYDGIGEGFAIRLIRCFSIDSATDGCWLSDLCNRLIQTALVAHSNPSATPTAVETTLLTGIANVISDASVRASCPRQIGKVLSIVQVSLQRCKGWDSTFLTPKHVMRDVSVESYSRTRRCQRRHGALLFHNYRTVH